MCAARFSSNRRRLTRLSVQPLEAREVPATIAVTTTADIIDPNDHKFSLREAITLASANPDADTITLLFGIFRVTLPEVNGNPNGNVGGDLDISGPVTIRGADASKTAVDGGGIVRVFDVIGQIPVTFANITIRNAGGSNNGAGIQSLSADLKLVNTLVTGNVGLKGGGINNENGSVTLFQSAVRGSVSTGDGGGINMGTGTLTATASKITNNVAKVSGGGVNSDGAVSLNQSVVSNNFANTGPGGGVRARSAAITGSSILQNQAGRDGGGVFTILNVDVSKSVISNNRALGNVGGGEWTRMEPRSMSLIAPSPSIPRLPAEGGYLAPTIFVTRSKVIGNTAQLVGGGMEGASVNVNSSTVSDNSVGNFNSSVECDGGGIWGLNDVTLNQSTVSDNFARDNGGGIYASTGANIDSSTLSGNSTSISTDDGKLRFGGGIKAAIAHLTNTTVSGNMSFLGGGVSMESGSLIN
jgi:CSLREA domain-containing protein